MSFQNAQHKYTILKGSREENCYIKGSGTQIALDFFTAMQKARNYRGAVCQNSEGKLFPIWNSVLSQTLNCV